MINPTFLDELDRFALVIKKRVTTTLSGKRKSPLLGRGTMIKDRRIYVAGDDFRLIDWKIYARTDKLHVKLYEEDKSLTTHILVDSSASMNFGKIKKMEYASMIGVGYAYLALRDNEKFQFSTFSENVEQFRAKKSLGHLASMIDYLNTLKIDGKTQFLDCIKRYKVQITNRSLIILVSDFLFEPTELRDAILFLGDHEIRVIQVLDPVEKNLSLAGDFDFIDLETSEHMRTYVSPKLRTEYEQRLANHNAQIEKVCSDLNVHFYSFATDTSIFEAFYEMMK